MTAKLLIVTTFNNEKERLQYTLENMLQQQSVDFVHLLIDDGSTNSASDEIVGAYIKKSKCTVCFEKHPNAGINEVHMRAFERTEEFGCSHFMWLDCGDGLREDAVSIVNDIINKTPDVWLHLDGYYLSDKKVKMSSRSYLPYLKKADQFIPFCFSVSTYGHFVIPFKVISKFNPAFKLVDGFYYDAQIIGALSLNSCPQRFVCAPLSRIQDDRHFSVTNSSGNSYSDNLLKLSEFVLSDENARKRAAEITSGMYRISVRQLIKGKNFLANRRRIVELKHFYKKNGIKPTERYKWKELAILSLLHLTWI